MEKKCTKCNKDKDFSEFFKCSRSKDGKQSQVCDYYKLNPEKRQKLSKEKSLEKYYRNRISMNFSRRMRKALNGLKNGMSWEKLVGYTVVDLKEHLEKQFTEGMTWDNYGEWHIDHKKPVDLFNITSVECEDFKECWCLMNLQPLWAIDNLVKGTKYII
jgi:hypothetical protein